MDAMSDDAWSAFIESAARLQNLPIDTHWHAAILANLKTIAAAARLVEEHPLADDDEAAPVFVA